jgi:hypothetical protein
MSAFETAYGNAARDFYDKRRSDRVLGRQKELYDWRLGRRKDLLNEQRKLEQSDEIKNRSEEQQRYRRGLSLLKDLIFLPDRQSGSRMENSDDPEALFQQIQKEIELQRIQPEQFEYLQDYRKKKESTNTIIDKEQGKIILYNKSNPADYKVFEFPELLEDFDNELNDNEEKTSSFFDLDDDFTESPADETKRKEVNETAMKASRLSGRLSNARKNISFLNFIRKSEENNDAALQRFFDERRNIVLRKLIKMVPSEVGNNITSLLGAYGLASDNFENIPDDEMEFRAFTEELSKIILDYSLSSKSNSGGVIILKELFEELTNSSLNNALKTSYNN